MTAYLRPREGAQQDSYLEVIISGVSPKLGKAERRGAEFVIGDHIVVAQRVQSSVEGGFARVPLAFRGIRAIDELLDVMESLTRESVICDFSIAARGVERFEGIADRCRRAASEFREMTGGNFQAKVSACGVSFEVEAFPSTGNISFRGTYNRYLGDVRGALGYILTGARPSALNSLRRAAGF